MKLKPQLTAIAAVLTLSSLLRADDHKTTRNHECPVSARGKHLEIKAISAPSSVDLDKPFNVFVTAVDEHGIGAIDITYNDQRVRLDGKGARFFTGIALLQGRPAMITRFTNDAGAQILNTLSVTITSVDGRMRSKPQTRQVTLTAPEELSVLPRMRDFQERLNEVNYPANTGATAHADWPVNVGRFDSRAWWIKWAEHGGPKHWDWTGLVEPGVTGIGEDGKVLSAWLEQHPNVAANLVWTELDPTLGATDPWGMKLGVVTHLSYPNWTDYMKYQLKLAVFRAAQYLQSGATTFSGTPLPSIPTNQLLLADHDSSQTILSREDAWNMYLGTVAHSLAVEIGGYVPWSIANYKASDLSVLLNAATMYRHIGGLSWYISATDVRSANGYFAFEVLPAPPTVNFDFMIAQDMIRPDHVRTLSRLFDWGRNEFHHTGKTNWAQGTVTDGRDAFSSFAYWGYRGGAPCSQIQKGTVYTLPAPWNHVDKAKLSWVHGCGATAEFMQETLRAVNIPVQVGNVGNTPHNTAFFWTVGAALSHGDDLDSADLTAASTPKFPSKWFLVPMAVYQDWFYGAGQVGPSGIENVGRQTAIEIPLKALSNELLQRYCADQTSKVSHANGTVAAFFTADYQLPNSAYATYYTVAQLEALNLWPRLAAKAVQLGYLAP